MNIDVKKILDQAKDSYDRYFKDAHNYQKTMDRM